MAFVENCSVNTLKYEALSACPITQWGTATQNTPNMEKRKETMQEMEYDKTQCDTHGKTAKHARYPKLLSVSSWQQERWPSHCKMTKPPEIK